MPTAVIIVGLLIAVFGASIWAFGPPGRAGNIAIKFFGLEASLDVPALGVMVIGVVLVLVGTKIATGSEPPLPVPAPLPTTTAAAKSYKAHDPWSHPDHRAVEDYINNECKPRTLSDFFGMISPVEGGRWNLYIFCKVEPEQDTPPAITVAVTEVNWPVNGAKAFIKESLNGREAVVLGIANGNDVWIAYKN